MIHKITYYIGIACAALAMSSCNDWLDVEPSTEVDKNALFSNEDGYADAMAGVYTNMTSDNLYGKNLTWYGLELMGGGATCMFGNNANYLGYYFHPQSDYYMEDMRSSFVDAIWNEQYNTIANVNAILANIDDDQAVFTGDDYKIFKGEALGLRAFLHFDLLRLFGKAGSTNPDTEAIPYVNSLTSQVYPMLTVKQCADAIIADLTEAKKLLEVDPMRTGGSFSKYVCSSVTGSATYRNRYGIADWHNRRFHFNYYAAVALMARAYLWMGDKTNALACAKEVIAAQSEKFPWVNPTLVANVASSSSYVSRDRTFCTEQIFALNITDMQDRMDGIMYEGENSFDGMNGNLMGFLADCFDDATRSQDPRYAYLKTTYSYYGYYNFNISTKYYDDDDYDNDYSPWSADRVPLMRVSEMYYIAAECEPDLDTAVAYLEAVRKNRGMSSYPLTCTSKEELQDEIEKEYRKEFIAEGQLFYYEKRLGKTITTSSAYSSSTITPELQTLPIPDDENTYGGRN